MRKEIIITLILLLVPIFIIFSLLYAGIGRYFYGVSIDPNVAKPFIEKKESEEDTKKREKELAWIKEKAEEREIESTKNGNLKLHAYRIKAEKESNIWVIALHGYMSDGTKMVTYAQKFYEKGYNVLLPDLRGHGKSEGDYIGMGWHDRLDIIDWINYLNREYPDCKIALFGVSMGAATVMMTTGEDLPKNVVVAVEDCGYTSVWDEFKYQLKRIYHLPAFPVLNAGNKSCKKYAGYTFKEASAIEQVKKSDIPTLFIHGDEDDFVPYEMLDELYKAADCEKSKLVIEGAGHGKAASKNPELYWNTVYAFINKYTTINETTENTAEVLNS